MTEQTPAQFPSPGTPGEGQGEGLLSHRQHLAHLLVFGFFASFFVLLSGGRVGSGDAGAQLQAAMLLASTGNLGIDQPPAADGTRWVQGRSGKWYEAHDIGNLLLMYLPAKIGMLTSRESPQALVQNPPIAARFAVAVAVAVWSAVGCLFVVKLFNIFWPLRVAFGLGVLFATGTFFWPYTKSAWDVGGGCVGTAILLYGAASSLFYDSMPLSTYVTVAMGFLIATAFRFSTAPFLALPLLLVLWSSRKKIDLRFLAIAALIVFVGLIPTLIYNNVRMGSPFRPATTADKYASAQSLNGEMFQGFAGLMASPNRGLVEFCPLALVLLALPSTWPRFPKAARQLTWMFGLGAVFYMLMIAKLSVWGAFGWGPRYLVPMLPVIFFPIAVSVQILWHRHRQIVLPLIVLSIALNGAAVLINWHLASTEDPRVGQQWAMLPYQQMAVWRGFGLALQGKPLPASAETMNDDIRKWGARFPDLWECRLMERSKSGKIAGLAAFCALAGLCAATAWLLLTGRPEQRQTFFVGSPVGSASSCL